MRGLPRPPGPLLANILAPSEAPVSALPLLALRQVPEGGAQLWQQVAKGLGPARRHYVRLYVPGLPKDP